MRAEPVLDDVGCASFQDIDAPAGLRVDEDRRGDEAPAQGEIVDPQHARHRQGGQGDLEEDPQRGMPGDAGAQRRAAAAPRPCRLIRVPPAPTWAVSREMRRW